MGKQTINKFFAIFVAFIMIFSMHSPMQASANGDFSKLKSLNDTATLQAKAAIAEQLNVLNGPARLHSDLKGLSGNQYVKVIVHLSEKPVALEKGIKELAGGTFSASEEKRVEKRVISQQEQVAQEMTAENISFSQGYTYNTVLNGFAAEVKADDLEKLLEIEGVTLVEPDTEMYAFEEGVTSSDLQPVEGQFEAYMNTSYDFLGIQALWNAAGPNSIRGQGIKVAVLDTGIDTTHPDLHVVGGKNFIEHNPTLYNAPRADNDARETLPSERPANQPLVNDRGNEYSTSHGTHVAGTIAALGNNPYGITGIAPEVELYSYRVLGAYGSGATSGIVAAIEYAVEQNMDVINLSLGGGSNSEIDASSFAINNATLAGVISVIATGNSGKARGTMGTPSTAPLGIAVGNSTNPETMFNAKLTAVATGDTASVTSADTVVIDQQLPLMATTFGVNLATQLNGEFELVAVPNLGKAEDFSNIDVNGKIALISRGEIPFVEKIANAKEAGAIGAIIHNNGAGIWGGFLGDSFDFIPTFDMSLADGLALRNELSEGKVVNVTFSNFGFEETDGDEINDSSSRGPSRPNFDIKPDVVAPGTNIMSTIPTYKTNVGTHEPLENGKAYDRKTGTSMATPHIAGIAALIKQANPSWTPFDVKVALSNTAKLLETPKYDVFDQGAGRVNAYAAAFPSVLAYVGSQSLVDDKPTVATHDTGTVAFGSHPNVKNETVIVTKQIVVKDINNGAGNYNVSISPLKSLPYVNISVDKAGFTLSGEEVLTVTLFATQNSSAKIGDEVLGYLKISSGSNEISLPYAADFGGVAPTEIRNMAITETDLSFNGDGIKDSALLTFTLTGDVGQNFIEIWDIQNPEGGYYEDGYIGYLHAGTSLAAGEWQLPVAGSYTPWGSTNKELIPDGLYTIDFSALSQAGALSDSVGPIFVKTTKPEFTVSATISNATATVVGQITDKYIDYKAVLAQEFGYNLDLNNKLNVTYQIVGKSAAEDALLNQDGSYEFAVNNINVATDKLKIVVTDAAGNSTEKIVSLSNPNPDNGGGNTGGGNSGGGSGGGGGATTPEAQPEEEQPEAEKPEETEQPEEQEKPAPFVPVDLPANHWAAGYIQQMIERGLLRGNENGEVKPNANVTRVQFASILARALNLQAENDAPFSDVGNYAAATQAEIAAIFEAGIAKGTDGKYMPSGEITRAQLALMLYRAYEHATGEKYVPQGNATFTDLGKYNEETLVAIAMLQELGIASGDQGKFMPTAQATRAHAAKMVIEFLEVIENR